MEAGRHTTHKMERCLELQAQAIAWVLALVHHSFPLTSLYAVLVEHPEASYITDNPYPNALDDILTLKPIRYRWKHEDIARDQIGLIAQSVLPIVPEAISTHAALEGEGDDTEYYSLRYCEVIPC